MKIETDGFCDRCTCNSFVKLCNVNHVWWAECLDHCGIKGEECETEIDAMVKWNIMVRKLEDKKRKKK